MKRKNLKAQRLKQFAKSGALNKKWINLIQKHGYFLQPIKVKNKDFQEAFNSKKTTDSARMIMIISTFLRDKEFAGRKLRHKSIMNVGITGEFNRQGKLKRFKVQGMKATGNKKGTAGSFTPFEDVKLTPKDKNDLLNGRVSPASTDMLLSILPDSMDPEAKLQLVSWLLEVKKHLANLLWLLGTALRLFDKYEVILYKDTWHSKERGEKGVYQADSSTIELHGFPQDLLHYIMQDEQYSDFYFVLEVMTSAITMKKQLRETYDFALLIDHSSHPTEYDAYEEVNKLVVMMAYCVRYVNDLINQIDLRSKTLANYAKRFTILGMHHREVYSQKRHKPYTKAQNPEGKNLTELSQKLNEAILNGLEGWEINQVS